jgi:hypothetical protein
MKHTRIGVATEPIASTYHRIAPPIPSATKIAEIAQIIRMAME